MLSESCNLMLKRHVDMKGRHDVCRELAISTTTLSMVLNDKYPASTDAIEERIMRLYGEDGLVECPVLGRIEVGKCATNYELAKKIKSAGNPATIRLYHTCRRCNFRNSSKGK